MKYKKKNTRYIKIIKKQNNIKWNSDHPQKFKKSLKPKQKKLKRKK